MLRFRHCTLGYRAKFQQICSLKLRIIILKMPKHYLCKKCGNVHAPPTGKKCQWQDETVAEEGNEGMMALLQNMQRQMDDMRNEMRQSVRADADSQSVVPEQEVSDSESEEDGNAQAAVITPESLRSDVRAMKRAAQRIA